MRRAVAAVCVMVALAGCRKPAETPSSGSGARAPAPEAAARALDAAAGAGLEMSGIDLYVHRKNPLTGISQTPKLWIRAERFVLRDSQTYTFESARAVAFGDKEEDKAIVMEAGQGTFEQDRRAALAGGATVTAGTLTIKTEAALWEQDDAQEAAAIRVDTPLTIDDPRLVLAAGGARLYPERKEFELLDVRGTLRFGGGS